MSQRWTRSRLSAAWSSCAASPAAACTQPPIAGTLGFRLAEVAPGFALFTMTPEFRHYNPIGTVHGGVAATLARTRA